MNIDNKEIIPINTPVYHLPSCIKNFIDNEVCVFTVAEIIINADGVHYTMDNLDKCRRLTNIPERYVCPVTDIEARFCVILDLKYPS